MKRESSNPGGKPYVGVFCARHKAPSASQQCELKLLTFVSTQTQCNTPTSASGLERGRKRREVTFIWKMRRQAGGGG